MINLRSALYRSSSAWKHTPDERRLLDVLREPSGKMPNVSLNQVPRKNSERKSRLHPHLYTNNRETEVKRLVKIEANRYLWRYRLGCWFRNIGWSISSLTHQENKENTSTISTASTRIRFVFLTAWTFFNCLSTISLHDIQFIPTILNKTLYFHYY